MFSVNVRCPCGRREEQAPCLRGGERGAVPLGSDGLLRLTCDEECESQRRLRAFATAIGTTPTSISAQAKVGRQTGGCVGENGLIVYSPFLMDFAKREPAAVSFFERELASIAQGRTRKVDLGCLPQLYRVVVHSLAELYLLDSESAGRAGERSIVVRHRGAGTKPIVPVPTLTGAILNQSQVIRNERLSPTARSLLIFVPSSSHSTAASMDIVARVDKELASHIGGFKIVRKEPMQGIGGDVGVLVEFSTRERLEAALSSLQSKNNGVVVAGPGEHAGIASSRSIFSSTNSLTGGTLTTAFETSGNSTVAPHPPIAPWGQSDISARRRPAPGGSDFAAQRLAATSAVKPSPDLTAVPDSWED
jgi:hypothetical protein